MNELNTNLTIGHLTLNELQNFTLKEVLEHCDIVKMQPFADEKGNILKIEIQYVPNQDFIANSKPMEF